MIAHSQKKLLEHEKSLMVEEMINTDNEESARKNDEESAVTKREREETVTVNAIADDVAKPVNNLNLNMINSHQNIIIKRKKQQK